MCVLVNILDSNNQQVVEVECGILVSTSQSGLIVDHVKVKFRQIEDLSFVGTCNKHICNNMIRVNYYNE